MVNRSRQKTTIVEPRSGAARARQEAAGGPDPGGGVAMGRLTQLLHRDKMKMVDPDCAIPGRDQEMRVSPGHAVLGTSIKPPFPEGMQRAIVGMGCFWGAERLFWMAPGVYTTAVGYSGGMHCQRRLRRGVQAGAPGTPRWWPSCSTRPRRRIRRSSGSSGRTTTRRRGMRQGNDVGTQYRSAIYYDTEAEREIALAFARCLPELPERTRVRRDHDRDRAGRSVLLRRGLPPGLPREESPRAIAASAARASAARSGSARQRA